MPIASYKIEHFYKVHLFKMLPVVKSVRILEVWMIIVTMFIAFLLSKEPLDSFYKFGPSSTLIILGISIDTPLIYSGVVIYCFINTCIRTVNNQIISPWITNVLHDVSVSKENMNVYLMYEIANISVIYTWVDWFIYFNILFAQIDMVLIEIVTDILVTSYVTRMYLAPVDYIPLGGVSLTDHK
jgi:hypothetical protein